MTTLSAICLTTLLLILAVFALPGRSAEASTAIARSQRPTTSQAERGDAARYGAREKASTPDLARFEGGSAVVITTTTTVVIVILLLIILL